MKLMLVLALVLAVGLSLVAADCASGSQQCTQTYIANAANFRTKDDICGGAQTFIDCFKAACNMIPDSVVQTMHDKIAAAGIDCDLHE